MEHENEYENALNTPVFVHHSDQGRYCLLVLKFAHIVVILCDDVAHAVGAEVEV